MRIRSLDEVKAFQEILNKCKGDVWMESVYGDRCHLKSELSQYVAIAKLLRDKKEQWELYATYREDEARLNAFIEELYRHSA